MSKKSVMRYKRELNFMLKHLIKIKFSNENFKAFTQGFDDGELLADLRDKTLTEFNIKEGYVFDNLLSQLFADGYISNLKTPLITTIGVKYSNSGGYWWDWKLKMMNLTWKIISSVALTISSLATGYYASRQYYLDKESSSNEKLILKQEGTIQEDKVIIQKLKMEIDSLQSFQKATHSCR
jgi:hypothetical protein